MLQQRWQQRLLLRLGLQVLRYGRGGSGAFQVNTVNVDAPNSKGKSAGPSGKALTPAAARPAPSRARAAALAATPSIPQLAWE